MTLEEAIALLNDNNVHEMVLGPGQLTEWLSELQELRAQNQKLRETIVRGKEEYYD